MLKLKIFQRLYKNWLVHRVVGHGSMNILEYLGYSELGIKIHDATLPPKWLNSLDRVE